MMRVSAEPDRSVATTTEARDHPATGIVALVTAELGRRDGEWRRTIESVKEMLAGLEHLCAASLSKLTDNSGEPAVVITRLTETLIAATMVEVEAAAERSRAEAQHEITRLQVLVEHLQTELQAQREKVRTAHEQLDKEHGTRARAEAAWQEAQEVREEIVSAYEARLHTVQGELEAERAEMFRAKRQLETEIASRAKLVEALHIVQRAVSLTESEHSAADIALAPVPQESVPRPKPVSDGSVGSATASHHVAGETLNKVDAAPFKKPIPTLHTQSQHAVSEPSPEIAEYLKNLFDQIEAMYWVDHAAALPPSDIVDRLTVNLRSGYDEFAHQAGAADAGSTALFDQQLMMLLDAKSATSFGRHLAIAAYQYTASQSRIQLVERSELTPRQRVNPAA